MLTLTGRRPWPRRLRPVGESAFEREPSSTWYGRNQGGLEHLDPRVLEQWVYRHWTLSPYAGLPLETLTSTVESWRGSTLLAAVGSIDDVGVTAHGDALGGSDGEGFLARFVRRAGRTVEPGTTMGTTGAWTIPVLLIERSGGFRVRGLDFSERRHWLLEGHLRFRYLRALHVAGHPDRDHEVLVVRYPGPLTRRPGRACRRQGGARLRTRARPGPGSAPRALRRHGSPRPSRPWDGPVEPPHVRAPAVASPTVAARWLRVRARPFGWRGTATQTSWGSPPAPGMPASRPAGGGQPPSAPPRAGIAPRGEP